jgi:hypothetical protein
MQVKDLKGKMLDHAVALANGWQLRDGSWWKVAKGPAGGELLYHQAREADYNPSEDWHQAGPFLPEYAISVCAISDAEWAAAEQITLCSARGSTYLEAAMRCYVASILGYEVDLTGD